MTETTQDQVLATIPVRVQISEERIRSLLCGAFEGGSNYWCYPNGYRFAAGLSLDDFRAGGKYHPADLYWSPSQLVPFIDGCAVILRVTNEDGPMPTRETVALTRDKLIRGLQLMADKYPQHFADLLDEDCDADTADVYLQMCIFGELIYS